MGVGLGVGLGLKGFEVLISLPFYETSIRVRGGQEGEGDHADDDADVGPAYPNGSIGRNISSSSMEVGKDPSIGARLRGRRSWR